MNIVATIISMILFLSSFGLFSYAFAVPEQWAALTFFAGILAVTVAMAIPISILGHRERD